MKLDRVVFAAVNPKPVVQNATVLKWFQSDPAWVDRALQRLGESDHADLLGFCLDAETVEQFVRKAGRGLTQKQRDSVRQLVPTYVFTTLANRKAGNKAGLGIRGAQFVLYCGDVERLFRIEHPAEGWVDLYPVSHAGADPRVFFPTAPVETDAWVSAMANACARRIKLDAPAHIGMDMNSTR